MSNIGNEMKSNVEKEFLDIEKGEGWHSFFNGIRNECAETHSYPSTEAKKSKNKDLNRYRDVNPYDHSRIILSKGSSDYINANLVVIEKAKRKYILTQGPLPQTTSHFWLMIWDQNCRAIVMLNRIIEKNMGILDKNYVRYYCRNLKSGKQGKVLIDLKFSRVSLTLLNFLVGITPRDPLPLMMPTAIKLAKRLEKRFTSRGVMPTKKLSSVKIKCHQYWPTAESSGEDKSLIFSDVNLKVTNVSEIKDSHYTTTTLRLEDLGSGNQREVIHYHYTTWPDFEVPQSPTAFLRFLEVVRSSGALGPDVGPAVVHCSAGIGRSGTFCLVDSCIVMIRDMNLSNVVVKDVLMEMRKFRMGLIQTPSQLRFSYLAVIKGINKAENANGLLDNDAEEVKEEESDEETPPLPPPRNESLARPHVSDEANNGSATANNDDDKREDAAVLHQRKKQRAERSQVLENKIKEMKKKLQESESWWKWKKSVFHPWSIGCLIVGGGILIYALIATRG